MQRTLVLVAFLAVALSCFGSEKAPRDPDHIRRYELALRHFLTVRHAPSDAIIYVAIGGAPAPPELIDRFRGARPAVHAWEKDTSILHRYYCAMVLGADYGDECYLVVWGYQQDVLHLYHFKKQRGEWQLLSDKVGYLS
jgi:hypothetical protein